MAYAAPLSDTKTAIGAARRERIQRRLAPSSFLAAPLRALGYDSRELWAWDCYAPSVLAFAEHCRTAGRHAPGAVRLLEVGSGRGPLLSTSQARSAQIACTVNDISAHELSLGPPEFAKAVFDVAGDIEPKFYGGFDLIISRMVMEHVRKAPRAWANMAALLAPGGVALAFHPTLYAPPFVLNHIIPESVTAPLLRMVFPDRHDGDFPKFPARYELCRRRRIGRKGLAGSGIPGGFERALLGGPLFQAHPRPENGGRRPERDRGSARLAASCELRLHDRPDITALRPPATPEQMHSAPTSRPAFAARSAA